MSPIRVLRHALPAIAAALLLVAPGRPMAGPVEDAIRSRIAVLPDAGASVGGVPVVSRNFIPAFYALRQDRPAWQGAAADELFAQIEAGVRNGFRPEDFSAAELADLRLRAESGAPGAVADFDIVATDVAARLLHHLFFGKVDAEKLDPDWNFQRPVIEGDPAETLNGYLDAGSFGALVADVELKHPQYLALIGALARYRAIAVAGGWPQLPPGETLKPGAADARIPLLRQRLQVTGDLGAAPLDGDAYDPPLVEAVQRFQARHGLDPDGVIGSRTLMALNLPAGVRVDQLRLSLERTRWILRGLGDEFVLVNIAGARAYFFRGGKLLWRTRSIVGQPYRKTPIFRDEIRFMELNPTWTVPSSIFLKDKLPKIRKDRSYLARNGFSVRDSQGRPIDPGQVNWSARNPGVILVQKPGPKNALGLVKFMFPNKYSVYMHDTDDHSLFDRPNRNLSSGCVRIEDPFHFADLLMEGDPRWTPERRDAILAKGETTRVNLPRPVPVLLTYLTAWVEDGQVQFREDIYGRDPKLLAALDGPFR